VVVILIVGALLFTACLGVAVGVLVVSGRDSAGLVRVEIKSPLLSFVVEVIRAVVDR
jgi:hypothetical protein